MTRWLALLALPLAACTSEEVGDSASDSSDSSEPVVAEFRVATWNVQDASPANSDDNRIMWDVIRRLDADIVALQEVEEFRRADLIQQAASAGYPVAQVVEDNPFGDRGVALLSKFPCKAFRAPDATSLSGGMANDLTRNALGCQFDIDGAAIVVVTNHLKAGRDGVDGFRRAVDAVRTTQLATDFPAADAVIVLGDLNFDAARSDTPPSFQSPPSGLPSSYELGSDIDSLLSGGLPNDPLRIFADAGLTPVAAQQSDGRAFTWPSDGTNGWTYDYVLVESSLEILGSEVYDSRDEPGTLPKAGAALDRSALVNASDHHPVLADLRFARD